jgi:hypothetical protein
MSPRADSLVDPRLQKPQVALARSTPRQAHSLWSRYPQNCLRPAETYLKLVALLQRAYLHLLHNYSHQQNPIYIGFSLLRTRRTIFLSVCRLSFRPGIFLAVSIENWSPLESGHPSMCRLGTVC